MVLKFGSPTWQVAVACLALCCVRLGSVQADDRLVYPGAIITTRASSSGATASGISKKAASALASFSKDSLGPRSFRVTERTAIQSLAVTNPETPEPYVRGRDLCRRAKTRRLLSQLGKGSRCSPNWALFVDATPNDPNLSSQYAVTKMQLPSAWDITTGRTDNQAIAIVIDTGIDYTHPDLAANMWSNPGEIPNNGVDDDANGYIDDYHGINAITNTGDPFDDNGHGTHVAGIMAARGNNGIGIAGVNWSGKLIAGKFLSATGSGSSSNAIKVLYYAIALKNAGHNIIVSNNSWGGSTYSSALASAISAASSAGILFVASAGNAASNNDTKPSYPASYDIANVISVASTTSSDGLSSFSNYGATSVDIAAPGSSILSTYPNNAYQSLSGTSMSAPQVAGVALLMQAPCSGSLTVEQMRNILLSTGTALPSLSGKVATGAIVNAPAAVSSAASACGVAAPPTSTPTPLPNPTDTPVSTATPAVPTPVVEPTATSTPIPTATATQTATPTYTATRTPTKKPTATRTPTRTPRPTATPTPTRTPRPTATATPTRTPRPTATPSRTPTPSSSKKNRR